LAAHAQLDDGDRNALLLTQSLGALGLADLTGTPYDLPPRVWIGVLAGSIAFGFGMAQAGGCVQRALGCAPDRDRSNRSRHCAHRRDRRRAHSSCADPEPALSLAGDAALCSRGRSGWC